MQCYLICHKVSAEAYLTLIVVTKTAQAQRSPSKISQLVT